MAEHRSKAGSAAAAAAGSAKNTQKLGFFARLLGGGGGKKDDKAKKTGNPESGSVATSTVGDNDEAWMGRPWSADDIRTRLVLRKRIFPDPTRESDDPLHTLIVFHQMRWELDVGLHYVHPESAAMLAALVKAVASRIPPIVPWTLAHKSSSVAFGTSTDPARAFVQAMEPFCPGNLMKDRLYKLTLKQYADMMDVAPIDREAATPEQVRLLLQVIHNACDDFI